MCSTGPGDRWAFRRYDAHTAEFKRIWTGRAHRRRGYAAALLAELEAQTAARGYRRVYLVTGNRQPEAEALYHAAGYTRLDEPLPAWGRFVRSRSRSGCGDRPATPGRRARRLWVASASLAGDAGRRSGHRVARAAGLSHHR
ncbi:acetyltransferase family protein [Mycobacterium xenopi 3993]|nr:acetyltransferase family protein [Mycobacterium xenopi 3993]